MRTKSLDLPTYGHVVNKVRDIKISCILNLALSFLKLSQWSNCIDACNVVILLCSDGADSDDIAALQSSDTDDHGGKADINGSEVDFKNKSTAKALYRRAQVISRMIIYLLL